MFGWPLALLFRTTILPHHQTGRPALSVGHQSCCTEQAAHRELEARGWQTRRVGRTVGLRKNTRSRQLSVPETERCCVTVRKPRVGDMTRRWGGQKRTRQEARQGGGEYYSWFSWHPDRLVCPRGGIVGEAHRPRFPPYTTCCHVRATTTNARRRRGVKDPGQSGACQALSFPNHIRQASPPMGHWPCSSSPSCRRDAGRAHSWHRVCSESADCRMPCIGTLARTLAMAMSTADDGTTPACLRPRRRRFVMAPDGRTENRSCPAASPQTGCEERGKRGRRDKKARPGQSPIRGPKISRRARNGPGGAWVHCSSPADTRTKERRRSLGEKWCCCWCWCCWCCCHRRLCLRSRCCGEKATWRINGLSLTGTGLRDVGVAFRRVFSGAPPCISA